MSAARVLDFNCDLGEDCGDDVAILPYISSASIACGGHAGSRKTMRETLRRCADAGVAVQVYLWLFEIEAEQGDLRPLWQPPDQP